MAPPTSFIMMKLEGIGRVVPAQVRKDVVRPSPWCMWRAPGETPPSDSVPTGSSSIIDSFSPSLSRFTRPMRWGQSNSSEEKRKPYDDLWRSFKLPTLLSCSGSGRSISSSSSPFALRSACSLLLHSAYSKNFERQGINFRMPRVSSGPWIR